MIMLRRRSQKATAECSGLYVSLARASAVIVSNCFCHNARSSASTGPRFLLASLHSKDTRKVMSLLHFSRRGGGTTHTKKTSLCWGAKTVWVKSIDANPRSQDCVSQRPFGQRVGSGPLKNLLLRTNRTTMLWVQFSLLAKNKRMSFQCWRHKDSNDQMLGGRSIHSSVHHHNLFKIIIWSR